MNSIKVIIQVSAIAAITLSMSACAKSGNYETEPQHQTQSIESQEDPTQVPPEILPQESQPLTIPETITELDFTDYFQGFNGCAVFYTPGQAHYDIYNSELSQIQSSPCSAFKIISSLIGLETGVINPADSVRQWNGTKYWKEDWNKDIGFEEAFKASCIWYFRKVTDQIGQPTVQEYLNSLNYGNCDISDWEGRLNTNNNNRDLTGFWVESSLKISPKEQAKVMSTIFEPNSQYSQKNLALLKQVMLTDQPNTSVSIYGKTGLGVKDGKTIDAWFTGMFQQNNETTYFSIRLDDPENNETSSQKAKEIAIQIITTHYSK